MEAVWLALATLTPALVNPASVRIYEPEKVALVRAAAIVLLTLWIWEGWRGFSPPGHQESKSPPIPVLASRRPGGLSRVLRKFLGCTPFAAPVVALMAAYLIAALVSDLPRISLLGNYRRQFGAATYLSFGAIFFVVATHLRSPDRVRRLLAAIALGSVAPALAAVLQMAPGFGLPAVPWLLDWLPSSPDRATSTLGNATYLGGYLAVVLPATLYLLARSRSARARALFGVLVGLQVAALALSGARASWLGAAAGALLMWALFESSRPRSRLLHSRPLQVGLGAALLLLAVANVPGTALHEAATEVPYLGRMARLAEFESGSGRVRALIWGQVPSLAAERPLFGHGPDTIAYSFEKHYPAELFHLEPANSMVDRTHNWLLETLASTGLAGTAALLVLLWSLAATYRRVRGTLTGRRGDGETGGRGDAGKATQNPALSTQHSALLVALAGVAAWLVDQSAGVPSAAPTLLLWLYLALASAGAAVLLSPAGGAVPSGAAGSREAAGGFSRRPGYGAVAAGVLAAVALAGILRLAVVPIAADVLAARGAALFDAGRPAEALASYRSALATDPEADHYLVLAQRAMQLAEQTRQGEAASWLRVAEEAVLGAERADPYRADAVLAEGRLYRLAAGLGGGQPQMEKALEAYGRALRLAPRRALVIDGYASVLLGLGRYEEALAQLQRSLELDPAYAATYGFLAEAYQGLGRGSEVLATFRRGLELDPYSIPLHTGLGRALARSGDIAGADREYQQALTLNRRNVSLWLEMADFYQRTGDGVRARRFLIIGLEYLPNNPDLTAALNRLPAP